MKKSLVAIIAIVGFTGCAPTDTCTGEIVSSETYENGVITKHTTCVTDTAEYEMENK